MQTLDLYIYRHAHSCSNIYKTKIYNYLSTRMYKKKRDPSLSVYGIATTLHSRNNDPPINPKEQIVYVSCLVRTWQTAFLKYFGFTKHLRLVVSPFLKEKHSFAFEISNTQESQNASVAKMRDLFQYCKNLNLLPIFDTKVTVSLFGQHTYIATFGYNFNILKKTDSDNRYYYNMLRKAEIKTKPSTYKNAEFRIDLPKRAESSLRLYKWHQNMYEEILPVTYNPDALNYYIYNDTTDSLIKFIAYVLKEQTSGKIIIVTHNHIMKEFVKKIEISSREIEVIAKCNLWMLNLTVNKFQSAIDVHTNYYQSGYAVIPLNEFDESSEYLCLRNRRWRDYPVLGGTRKKKKTRRHYVF